ncbi:MAG: deoxyribose-phosphate aldolase [Bacteroidia bacterium]|nr:deoxyribose-phosphate aldolase [Bacteroidia bacterium]MCX7651622.1 deoxyribose-phosphate aldolase [Bacteroidia bacterium]MDW8417293.1 deoxyribose-phosphate aldolase [Bacteroidia bacterium]
MNPPDLSRYIDYTLLRPGCTREEILALCDTAIQRRYAAVCVPPYFVSDAVRRLEGSLVAVATVVGFPHGMQLTEIKAEDARLALAMGARELDMVINLSAYFSGDERYVRAEIQHLAELAHAQSALLKVILETALLSPSQIQELCHWAADAGADFVKTSTGFAAKGAEIEAVKLMRDSVPASVGVKASGGIRTAEAAWAFIQAGATRIGTSSAL